MQSLRKGKKLACFRIGWGGKKTTPGCMTLVSFIVIFESVYLCSKEVDEETEHMKKQQQQLSNYS